MYDIWVLYERIPHISVNEALLSAGVVLFCIHIFLVRLRRWERYNAIHKKYGPKWNNGKGSITPAEAQIIMQMFMRYDLPIVLDLGLAFATTKTYSIVSFSYSSQTLVLQVKYSIT